VRTRVFLERFVMFTREDLMFGVEIETQNEKDCEPDFDQSDYHEEICEEIYDRVSTMTRRQIIRECSGGSDLTISYDTAWDSVLDRLREEAEEKEPLGVPDCYHKHSDGSVEGWEYVFCRPVNYTTANKWLKNFPWGDAEIDSECSFHIHVSWPDIAHYATRQLKLLISLGYLCTVNKDLASIIEARVERNSWCDEYYAERISTGKYCAISQRKKDDSTYEFRIFGYVTNIDEAKACIDAAANCCLIGQLEEWDKKKIACECDLAQETSEYLQGFFMYCCDKETNISEGKKELFERLLSLVPEKANEILNPIEPVEIMRLDI
jgi:hypothetical protein